MKNQNNIKIIGDKIKQLRNMQDLKQDKLSCKSNLLYTPRNKIESNVITKPSVQTMAKIAKALGVLIEDLIK
jgi:transcriptional regulator with XRE-family HTH domain